jgi:lipopolysaccharide transport system ATP-binding protein
MAYIFLDRVEVDFPIFNAKSRSLKSRMLNIATGGAIASDNSGHIVVRALDNINIEINHGERVGLVGHNGSGKTTLLRVLSKIFLPTFGSAIIEGVPVPLINISLGIDPESTGRENIFIRGALMGMPKKRILDIIDEVIDFAELGDFIEMPVRTYSSGMYLRLAFTIATAIQPEILIMDEWLSAGDESFQIKAKRRFDELVGRTSILVVASHSRDTIQHNCTRAIWMEHGHVKLDGEAEEVLDAYFGSQA